MFTLKIAYGSMIIHKNKCKNIHSRTECLMYVIIWIYYTHQYFILFYCKASNIIAKKILVILNLFDIKIF